MYLGTKLDVMNDSMGAGMYALAEIDLKGELPAASLQPFSADLAARAARREARAAEQNRQDALDAERAEAMHKSQAGPSAAELKASASCCAYLPLGSLLICLLCPEMKQIYSMAKKVRG